MRAGVELAAAYAHCRAVAKREAKNFYYGFVALPPQKRDAMCAMYAFMRRADDIADDERFTLEQRRAEMTRWIGSWHGEGEEEPQDRPVFLAVQDVQQRFGVTGDLLEQLVHGTAMDLDENPPEGVQRVSIQGRTIDQYASMEALERYCYYVASVVGLTTIRIFGCRDPRGDACAVQLGHAFQLTNILRDVKEDAERGRIYLPKEVLQKHGLTSEDVLHTAASGTAPSPRIRAVLAEIAAYAEEKYNAQSTLIPLLAPDSRAAMRVLVRIYHLLLRRIVSRRYDVFSERVRVSTPRKLLVLAAGWLGGIAARFPSPVARKLSR